MTDQVVGVNAGTPAPPPAPKEPAERKLDDTIPEKKFSKPLIPFGWLPGHWGLKGKSRERAEIEYTYDAHKEELARRLAHFDLKDGQLEAAIAKIDYEYNHISLFEYKKREASAYLDGNPLKIALLDLDRAEGNINDIEYDKEVATVHGEPWVHILKINPDSTQPNHGEMELDWNDKFVDDLREAGYEGTSDEAVVDVWLADLCRNIAMEQFSGVGDFDEQVGDGFINRSKGEDGKWVAS